MPDNPLNDGLLPLDSPDSSSDINSGSIQSLPAEAVPVDVSDGINEGSDDVYIKHLISNILDNIFDKFSDQPDDERSIASNPDSAISDDSHSEIHDQLKELLSNFNSSNSAILLQNISQIKLLFKNNPDLKYDEADINKVFDIILNSQSSITVEFFSTIIKNFIDNIGQFKLSSENCDAAINFIINYNEHTSKDYDNRKIIIISKLTKILFSTLHTEDIDHIKKLQLLEEKLSSSSNTGLITILTNLYSEYYLNKSEFKLSDQAILKISEYYNSLPYETNIKNIEIVLYSNLNHLIQNYELLFLLFEKLVSQKSIDELDILVNKNLSKIFDDSNYDKNIVYQVITDIYSQDKVCNQNLLELLISHITNHPDDISDSSNLIKILINGQVSSKCKQRIIDILLYKIELINLDLDELIQAALQNKDEASICIKIFELCKKSFNQKIIIDHDEILESFLLITTESENSHINKSIQDLVMIVELDKLAFQYLNLLDTEEKNNIANELLIKLSDIEASTAISTINLELFFLKILENFPDFSEHISNIITNEQNKNIFFTANIINKIAEIYKYNQCNKILFTSLSYHFERQELLNEQIFKAFLSIFETEFYKEDYFYKVISYLTAFLIDDYEIDDDVIEKISNLTTENKYLENSKNKFLSIYNELSNTRNYFQIGEKSASDLIAEISRGNSFSDEFISNLESSYNAINAKMLTPSRFFHDKATINQWSEGDIFEWSKVIKELSFTDEPSINYEVFAVIKQATKLFFGYDLRDVQLLSLLILVNQDDSKGVLAQISTGEGKSTITAILAIYNALQGKKVDVVTSSKILASRDVIDKAGFFAIFDLSVADNKNDENETKSRECYLSDIVYGSTENYQYDILRDEYKLLNTRNHRPFEVVIIDEVDSMTIDQAAKIAMISSSIPAMEYIERIYCQIWLELIRLINHTSFDEDEEVWIYKTSNITEEGEGSVEEAIQIIDREYFIYSSLKKFIEKLVDPLITEGEELPIPQHLLSFIHSQISVWVDSAITAFQKKPDRDYIIKLDDNNEHIIVPVDFSNTGVSNIGSNWSNGLHQFLQIKHSLKIHPESITTCFISNAAFFKRYGKEIYGISGTLGSDGEQSLLQKIYNVNICTIPTFKEKQFIEEPAIITSDSDKWLKEILENIQQSQRDGRSCLIICQTISGVNIIEEELVKKGVNKSLIKIYSRSDLDHASSVTEKVIPGEVVIATNLAGRGTDLKISKLVELNGGLQVIVTYLPHNLRVEEQAFGRAARQGQPGSAKLIINSETCAKYLNNASTATEQVDIATLKALRNKAEIEKLEHVREFEYPLLSLKDELFEQYKLFYRSLNSDDSSDDNPIIKAKLEQLEELWGYFLNNLFDKESIENHYQADFIAKKFNTIKGKAHFKYDSIFEVFVDFLKNNSQDEELKLNSIDLKLALTNYILKSKNIDLSIDDSKISEYITDHELAKAFSNLTGIEIKLYLSEDEMISFEPEQSSSIQGVKLEFLELNRASSPFKIRYLLSPEIKDQGYLKVRNEILTNCVSFIKDYINKLAELPHLNIQQIDEIYNISKQIIIDKFNRNLITNANTEFAEFSAELSTKFADNLSIFENPIHLIQAGLTLEFKNRFSESMQVFDHALQLDRYYAIAAYYYKAYLLVNEQSEGYKQQASSLLAEASYLINNILKPSNEIVALTTNATEDSELHKQINNKQHILTLLNSSIISTKAVIDNSKTSNDIQLRHFKRIIDLIDDKDDDYPISEVYELAVFGFIKTYNLEEVSPALDVGAIAMIFICSAAQLALGAICAISGNYGLAASFIINGIEDIVKGFEAVNGKQINLKDYFTEKSIQLVVIGVSYGVCSALEIGSAVSAPTSTGLELAKEVSKETLKKMIESYAVNSILDKLSEGLSKEALRKFKHDLEREINENFDSLFANPDIAEKISHLAAIDSSPIFKTSFISSIIQYSLNLFKSKQSYLKSVLGGVLSDVAAKPGTSTKIGVAFKAAAAAYKTADLAIVLDQVISLTHGITEKIAAYINEIHAKAPTIEDALYRGLSFKLDKSIIAEIIQALTESGIIKDGNLNIELLTSLADLNKAKLPAKVRANKILKNYILNIGRDFSKSQNDDFKNQTIAALSQQLKEITLNSIYNRMQQHVTKKAIGECLHHVKDKLYEQHEKFKAAQKLFNQTNKLTEAFSIPEEKRIATDLLQKQQEYFDSLKANLSASGHYPVFEAPLEFPVGGANMQMPANQAASSATAASKTSSSHATHVQPASSSIKQTNVHAFSSQPTAQPELSSAKQSQDKVNTDYTDFAAFAAASQQYTSEFSSSKTQHSSDISNPQIFINYVNDILNVQNSGPAAAAYNAYFNIDGTLRERHVDYLKSTYQQLGTKIPAATIDAAAQFMNVTEQFTAGVSESKTAAAASPQLHESLERYLSVTDTTDKYYFDGQTLHSLDKNSSEYSTGISKLNAKISEIEADFDNKKIDPSIASRARVIAIYKERSIDKTVDQPAKFDEIYKQCYLQLQTDSLFYQPSKIELGLKDFASQAIEIFNSPNGKVAIKQLEFLSKIVEGQSYVMMMGSFAGIGAGLGTSVAGPPGALGGAVGGAVAGYYANKALDYAMKQGIDSGAEYLHQQYPIVTKDEFQLLLSIGVAAKGGKGAVKKLVTDIAKAGGPLKFVKQTASSFKESAKAATTKLAEDMASMGLDGKIHGPQFAFAEATAGAGTSGAAKAATKEAAASDSIKIGSKEVSKPATQTKVETKSKPDYADHTADMHVKGEAVAAPSVKHDKGVKSEFQGRALREEAIPPGSKIEYISPGQVKFDGVIFKAVRDLSHLDDQTLFRMYKNGINPYDYKYKARLDGHHHRQQYHREDGAFIVEMPSYVHKIDNPLQHPFGRAKDKGLTKEQRRDWNNLKRKFNKDRARNELIKRGLLDE